MDTKRCVKCLAKKNVNNFWWVIKNVIRDSWCKECQKERKRIRNRQRRVLEPAFREREQDANRKCYTTEKGRVRSKRWRETNDLAYLSHYLVDEAIKHGRLTKQPCQVCGNDRSEAHHPDHRKMLEVVWLCRRHHAALNRKEGLAA